MIEKWQEENYFIFTSDLIYLHAGDNIVDMRNIESIGGAGDKYLHLAREMSNTLRIAGIKADSGKIMSLAALDNLEFEVEDYLSSEDGRRKLKDEINNTRRPTTNPSGK